MRVFIVAVLAAMFFVSCGEDSSDERTSDEVSSNSSKNGVSRDAGGVGATAPGGIRIEDARWVGDEVSVRGEVEGGGYVIFCDLREGGEGESRSVRHDTEASGVEVVGDTFVYTFVESEAGWEPPLEYRVFCALAGGGGGGPNSFDDPFDESKVAGEPPKE